MALAVIVGAYAFFGLKRNHNFIKEPVVKGPVGNPYILPCDDGGDERTISFNGVAKADKLFLRSKMNDDEAAGLVKRQLKYLFGVFFLDEEIRKVGRFFPSSAEPEIKITGVAEEAYGIASVIAADSKPVGGTDYLSRAMAAGVTHADDPAYVIKYTASWKIAGCVSSRKSSSLALNLPYDPYLAPWLVAQSLKRPMKWGNEKSVVTPCASPEVVHLKFPDQFWIVWDPTAKGTDTENKKYDCESILTANKDYGRFEARLGVPLPGRTFMPAEPLREIQGPIQVAAVFGPLEPWTKKLNIENLYSELVSDHKTVFDSAKETAEKFSKESEKWDVGYLGFVHFVRTVPNMIEVSSTSVLKEASAIIIKIDGRFLISRHPVHLELYYGDTNVDAFVGHHHWPFLAGALENDDIIFYTGHSGMGKDLDLNLLAADAKISGRKLRALTAKKTYQFITSISCNAYSYFAEEFRALRSAPPLKTDLMMMATTNYRPMIHFGLLRYIDRILNGEKPQVYTSLSSFITGDDIFVFSRFAND